MYCATCVYGYPQKPGEGVRFLETRVTGGWEPPTKGAMNWMGIADFETIFRTESCYIAPPGGLRALTFSVLGFQVWYTTLESILSVIFAYISIDKKSYNSQSVPVNLVSLRLWNGVQSMYALSLIYVYILFNSFLLVFSPVF